MKKFLNFTYLVIALILSVTVSSAQDSISLAIESVNDGSYPNLTFEVTPNNEFGVPLSGLSANDFLVSDDEGPLPINFLSLSDPEKPNVDPNQPISIMLALDVSGSIVRAGSLNQIKESATQLRESLGASDEMGVLFFNVAQDGTRVVEYDSNPEAGIDPREIRPTLDGGAVINFINEFNSTDDQAGTPLYDAIYRSVQVLNQDASAGRRAVIVMTDGIDEGREAGEPGSIGADLDLAIREANRLKIPIFTIGVGQNIDVVELRNIASGTGADEVINASVEDLDGLFIDIADRLKTKYLVQAEARVRPDNQEHALMVQVETDLGTAEASTSFQARFPFQPIIELEYLTNDGEIRNSNRLIDGVEGTIELRPSFSSRNPINLVDIYIDDILVSSLDSSPFVYEWDTTMLSMEDNHLVRIEAFDNAEEPNFRVEEFAVQVNACDARCQIVERNSTSLDNSTFIYILGGLAALILLTILFVIFYFIRNRRSNDEGDLGPLYEPGPVTGDHLPPPAPFQSSGSGNSIGGAQAPSATIVDPGFKGAELPHLDPTITPGGSAVGAAPGGGIAPLPPPIQGGGVAPSGGGYRPPAKTEVLTREPDFFAYLLNPSNQQQFRISSEKTTIGRNPENNIRLDESSVSGNHAAIRIEDKKFVIYDLGAANPVKVNGTVVRDPVSLTDGDQLTFGRLSFFFKVLDSK